MRFTTAAEAVKLICPHSNVYIQGSTSIPEVLVRAMTDRAAELTDVTLYSGFAVGRADAPYCSPEYKDTFLVNSLFVANNIRRWLAQGYGQSIPAFLGEIPGLFRDGTLPVDVAILNLSRPNEEGYCSFGVSADLAVSAVECARTVIAQVNTAMPFSYGDAMIHLSRVAAAVEVDDPLVEVPSATPTDIERRIGNHIAELIPDGATLQIGVGGIPNAAPGAATPVAYTDIARDEIARNSFGSDIPSVLALTPSMVATNETGIGIGRHLGTAARHGRHAPERDDQRRFDEQPRLALDVLVRHARPDLVGRDGAGAARRRHLDQRHGCLRRRGEHDHRGTPDRFQRLGIALLRIVQHQQTGRAGFVGPHGRPLGRGCTPDPYRFGRLHRPRSHGS